MQACLHEDIVLVTHHCGTCDNFCSSTSRAKFDRHVEDVTSDMPWTTMCTNTVAIFYICSIMKQPSIGNISSVKVNTYIINRQLC